MGGERDLSRRGFIGAAAGTTAAVSLGAAPAVASSHGNDGSGNGNGSRRGPGERLALVNGKIHTFDKRNRVVREVLIEDGKFTDVGRSVRRGSDTRVVNVRGRTVIPGIIDNHVHYVRIGQAVGHDLRLLETAFSIEAA